MSKYDPDECDRVIAGLRKVLRMYHYQMWAEHLDSVRDAADQLEAARAEITSLNRHVEDIGKAQDRAEDNEKAWHAENIDLRERCAELAKERDVFREMYTDAFGTKDADNDALTAEVKRMRPVVDAALGSYGSQRGGHFGQPRPTDAMLELANAVDAYRASKP